MKSNKSYKNSNNYRQKIKELIPGGAHTYSKGDDQFPSIAPAAISHGKGAYVWDVDLNRYLDCSMGLTSVSLGHAYPSVIEKVKTELEKGVNFQRPGAIELEMAERFLTLVPSHDRIKFAKNGSSVTTAAVKLARAFTGRDLVAFPGDHPFYSFDDWFIGRTVCSKGVPENVQKLSLTYQSSDLSSLERLFDAYPNQIACVISEPPRHAGQSNRYLEDIISIAHTNGTLFIQDEMITGFKVDYPGAIKQQNVQPDLATWGKGIANGFSFCALTGKRDVMELGGIQKSGSERVFLLSSTHGGETHAIAAGLATMDVFETEQVVRHNHTIGERFLSDGKNAVEAAGLAEYIDITPCNWMPMLTFKDRDHKICNGMRTLFMQEMIQRDILFQGVFVPCFSHTEDDIRFFFEALTDIGPLYLRALEQGFRTYLKGEPTKPVFRKYN